jgi:hypothetical protein
VNQYSLNTEAARIAWKFLSTGRIVTEDGEIVSAERVGVGSPAPTATPSHSEPSASEITSLFLKYFPNEVGPTSEQMKGLSTISLERLDNILYTMAYGTKPITTPVVLALWKIHNESEEKNAQDRESMERKGRSGDSIVREASRKLDALIPTIPPPVATEDSLSVIRAMRERLGNAGS